MYIKDALCLSILLSVFFKHGVVAEQWPYNRYSGKYRDGKLPQPNKQAPEHDSEPVNQFLDLFRNLAQKHDNNDILGLFRNNTISDHVNSFHELLDHIDVPDPTDWQHQQPARPLPTTRGLPNWSAHEAEELFGHLKFELDPGCIVDKTKWWYRTYDGSCNWLKLGETNVGQVATARSRDYNQHAYADGISLPRDGPNPRAVSNAFFKRNKTIYYEHTPLLLGLVEFLMHDVTWSQDSTTEYVDVPMPPDETEFYPNTTLRVWRTAALAGTGTSNVNPREHLNMATTWLDLSALYGSTEGVARALRSFKGGKLLTQDQTTRGRKTSASYLPFNTMGVPTRTRPGVDPQALFAGGDPRTNEDWVMLGVHTLLLREHNRLCGILAGQHPEFDDERLYQTVRIVMSAKIQLIGNSYQMAYWNDEMPWPRDDGFPLFRQMHAESFLDINPANVYPWPLVTKSGKPTTVSAEMAVVYRFHEFIIPHFPVKNAMNETLWDQDLFETGFNATGFIDAGLENVLRGMVATSIPNFKSGVDEAFRTAGKYRGAPFDVVTWSIVHEREQGLPTFNQYFEAYNAQGPAVQVPIRRRFEDFSTNPEAVANLKRLYKTPDDVDLVVGVQLDEEYFPGATIPKSALIISLFSLFAMGNSDRFGVGFAMMRCWLVDTPWDCHPSNALEDLLWKPVEREGFPDFRWYDTFWMKELDLQAHGTNLLWRLITENTDIQCLQKKPLFPYDLETNPLMCSLPQDKLDVTGLVVTGLQVSKSLFKEQRLIILTCLAAGVIAFAVYQSERVGGRPPVIQGWPIIGNGLAFMKNGKDLLQSGLSKYGSTFGMKLGNLTYFVLTDQRDLEMLKHDNPYETKFNLAAFRDAIHFTVIVQRGNTDILIRLIELHLSKLDTLKGLARSIDFASQRFLDLHPPEKQYAGLNAYLNQYMAYIVSYCIIGPDGFDDPELLEVLVKFNDDALQSIGLAPMLPAFLQCIVERPSKRNFTKIRKVAVPAIRKLRKGKETNVTYFLPFILDAIDDDNRASDLAALVIWAGLVNLETTLSSTILDIINEPGLQEAIVSSLKTASTDNLDSFRVTLSWSSLRSAMFESVRLSAPIATAVARVIQEDTNLASEPTKVLPKGAIATISQSQVHRQEWAWGKDAAQYKPARFLNNDPPIGDANYVPWGLSGPHMCPGRWFAQVAIQIATKNLLERYNFTPDRMLGVDDRYKYVGGVVFWADVPVTVTPRE